MVVSYSTSIDIIIVSLIVFEIFDWFWATGAPKNLGFHFNISITAEASDLKVNERLGFTKAHHKTSLRRKVGWLWAREALRNLTVSL